MRSIKRLGIAGIAGAVASAAALAVSVLPAQAATPGWRQVFSQHYGAKADYSGFTSTSAFGKNDLWALGGSDTSLGDGATQQVIAIHWNGHAWSANKAPAGLKSYIDAASAPSSADIWAVTFSGGYVLHWNGAKWSVAKQLPGEDVLSDVVATSATNVWAFGSSVFGPSYTWHYDGRTWTKWTGRYDFVNFASAVSANDIWGIGDGTSIQSAIEHFNGHAWSPVTSSALNGLMFKDIRAFGPSNVWAAASAQGTSTSYLVHYSGHWSKVKVPWGLSAYGAVTSDGHGGLWFNAQAQTSQGVPGPAYEVHWLPGNKWQRTAIGAGVRLGAGMTTGGGPELIPGTTSVVAAGQHVTGPGRPSAVIWAYGSV
jgi:hypothetical protein